MGVAPITNPAPRHTAAISALELGGNETLLEIGCGHGVATRLALDRLPHGRIVALDRSQKMIDAVAAGSPEALAVGRLSVRAEALEDADFDGERFDAIVAINVDLNLRLGTRWAPLLKALLKPQGRLILAFDPPPGSAKGHAFADKSLDRLSKAGFEAVILPAHGRVTVIRAHSVND